MLGRRWKISPANRELQERLGRKLNILPLTAQLLVNRGLVDADKAFSFLKPDLASLHDPMLMKGMDRAVERIARALREREKITVYGDYDVDGATSTALLSLFLREIGADAATYIPERLAEGYGLNPEAVKKLAASGCRLVITVDCGSSNRAEVELANSLGIDVIVTDHHEMPKDAPPALAVLNPGQEGCRFPFKGLAGVGVAFNLALALRAYLRETGWFREGEPNLKRYLDLVALGTVADLVPLMDENRVFVHYGLKELEAMKRPGLKALVEGAGLKGRLSASHIAFQMAPRLNAAGRISTADTALRLLTTESPEEASALAAALEKENSSRQRIEAETLEEALSMLEGHRDRGIVLYSERWHPGVIGIVASRLVDRFSRPAVLIALENGVGKGSARSIRSFNILEGLKGCAVLLERFGGHKAAAGLTVSGEMVEAFRKEFIRQVNGALTDEDLVSEMTLDAVVSLEEVGRRLVSEIESLAPFGASNHEPLLCLPDTHIVETEVVGARHLKFKVKHNGRVQRGIGFGLAGLHPVQGKGYGIAFSPYMDEWQGNTSLRLRIKDVKHGFANPLT
ncbi:MAG: single-stranded-DNA-specific exonuclease RecJ [Thermodesulfobacteriota bacterium]|nr:MAG: single-stranded-DNA-specific exonuclease RecJ [Thermodesulfobacteriota bacterium]